MNLTKEQALVIYVFMQKHSGELSALTKESSQVRLVCDELQRFLTSSDAGGTHACEGCDGACHEDDTLEMEDDEGSPDLAEPEAAESISASSLHDLPVVKTTSGSLEFEHVEGDEVNILLDGGTELESVSRISRTARGFKAWSRCEPGWSEFTIVGKFPKMWIRLIPSSSRVCSITDE